MKPAWGWGRIATVEKAGNDLEIRVGVAVGMEEMGALLGRWRMDEAEMRRRMYRAPTLRERERWHAVWLLAQGWTAAAVPVSPSQAGIDLSNWNWKVVRRFCCAIGWVSQSSQGTLRTNTILLRRVYTLLSSERWEKAWGQPYRTLSRG